MSNVPLPDSLFWSNEYGSFVYSTDQMHAHAAAVSAAENVALREVLWIMAEHNELHFGKNHSTVIQARAALGRQP